MPISIFVHFFKDVRPSTGCETYNLHMCIDRFKAYHIKKKLTQYGYSNLVYPNEICSAICQRQLYGHILCLCMYVC